MYDKTCGKTEVSVKLAHPLGVTACEVIVDSNDVHTLACKTVKVCRKSSNKSFTFTCFHLGNSALMKYDTADNLYRVMLHTKHSPCALSAYSKGIGQDVVCGFAVCKTLLENCGLVFELAFAHSRILILKCKHLVTNRLDSFKFFFTVIAKQGF